MEADYFIGVAQQALWILALASAPILIPVLVIGVLLGMVQAVVDQRTDADLCPETDRRGDLSCDLWRQHPGAATDFTRDIFAQIPALVR